MCQSAAWGSRCSTLPPRTWLQAGAGTNLGSVYIVPERSMEQMTLSIMQLAGLATQCSVWTHWIPPLVVLTAYLSSLGVWEWICLACKIGNGPQRWHVLHFKIYLYSTSLGPSAQCLLSQYVWAPGSPFSWSFKSVSQYCEPISLPQLSIFFLSQTVLW